jgi:hypothetical protein
MNRKTSLLWGALALTTVAASVHAQDLAVPTPATTPLNAETKAGVTPGSTAFCLYELPADGEGKRRWLNLGIVQYIELNRNELRIYYGGGNFGGGYEARIPVPAGSQVQDVLDKIRQTAAGCH